MQGNIPDDNPSSTNTPASLTVSNPSIVHKPSKQSITASEDYYSLSSGDSAHLPAGAQSTNTIHRYQTPPSRYRTPASSQQNIASIAQAQYAIDESADPEVRKTPMRGEGKRRQSFPESSSSSSAGPSTIGPIGAMATLREGGVRRKPVPSTVIEDVDSPKSQEFVDPNGARSSVARDLDQGVSPPTPGQDDTPYIRFALDQLTRDEEVRGSRQYPGVAAGTISAANMKPTRSQAASTSSIRPVQDQRVPSWPGQPTYQHVDEPDRGSGIGAGTAAAGAGVLGAGALAAGAAYAHNRDAEQRPPPSQQWPDPSRRFDQPPPRDPRHVYINRNHEPDVFIPVTNEGRHQAPLDFLPGILKPLSLMLFILVVLVVLALLLTCAIWSLIHKGIFSYGSFGDSKYFIFEYLPTILGMLILYWLFQIEVAAYRIAPFLALSSLSPRSWEEGAKLPMYPKTFLLPYFGHFSAKQGAMGFFVFVCWLQVWTIPLLASSFNVFFFGQPSSGLWKWTATAAPIWIVIGLYILLIVAVVMLMLWLRRQQKNTGLRWDPRSLADMVVLLERSNALSFGDDEEIRHDAPRLGYWRTSRGGNNVFHSYGVADKPARRYSLDGSRIVEKTAYHEEHQEPKSRFSSQDLDISREQRNSREKMLPKHLNNEDMAASGGRAVPWYLRTSAALLWVIMAIVLLLAFLIVSYLPSTAVSNGFDPRVAAPVNNWGYSATNFLYSFMPAALATICFLGLLDIDYAYRRLAPYSSLLADEGELAEKSLLLSYPADLPGIVTASALANGHFRVAILSIASLISIALPILGSGVFFAEFDVPTQSIIISSHMAAYYALSAFVALYAIAIIIAFPWDRRTREIDSALPRGNQTTRWRDIVSLFRSSRLLDDVAFRNPTSKTDLVTRLLSAPPGTVASRPLERPTALGKNGEAAASKVSLADSVRGFGRARLAADAAGAGTERLGVGEVPRFGMGLFTGRDGREFVGVDRLRS